MDTVKRIKLRTLFVGGLITLLFLVLFTRIFWVQVVKADFWLGEAKKIWAASDTIPAERGTITDRNGNLLAMNIPAYTVVVNPKVIQELGIEDQVADGLSKILGKPKADIVKQVSFRNAKGEYSQYRELRPEGLNIEKKKSDEVAKLSVQIKKDLEEKRGKKISGSDMGITLIKGSKRLYPNNTLAAHLLGFVNKQGDPVIGLEADFNDVLKGTDGKIVYEKDGNRVQVDNGTAKLVPAVNGKNIKLTIDNEIQHYVQDAIQEAYDLYKPQSITAIVADPNSMEVLGMANLPTFDPNSYSSSNPINFNNLAVGGTYEPGSTFKIVTLAGAVQEKMFNPNEEYMSGRISVPGQDVYDIKRSGWGPITYLEGLKRSSNVAFVHLGMERLGKEKLTDYIRNFGFGTKTGIEIKQEVRGSLNIQGKSDVARASFGQGPVSVTPIQQVAAVAAVANGGKLLKPHIVKEIDDPAADKKTETQKEQVRQVITAETSKLTSGFLEQVVSDSKIGTGRNAAIAGYRVAGKTGTAQKIVNGTYSKDKYVVSFIGYAPVSNPRFVVYVIVDSPSVPDPGGGKIAAPVFKKIVTQSLRYMGVKPDVSVPPSQDKKQPLTVPDLTGLTLAKAQQELKARGLASKAVGKGASVLKQMPAAGTIVSDSQSVYLVTEEENKLQLPSLAGSSLREALQLCSSVGRKCVTEGEGYVISQMEAKLNGEPVVKLTLKPPAGQEATDTSAAGSAAAGGSTSGDAKQGGGADAAGGKPDDSSGSGGSSPPAGGG